jgi:hypothetical protein
MSIHEVQCYTLLDRNETNNNMKIFNDLFKNDKIINIGIFNKTLKSWLLKQTLCYPGFKLSPSLLRYIKIRLKCKIECCINKKNNRTYCYINIDGETKKIRTQDWFSYIFLYLIKKKLNIKKKKKTNSGYKIYKKIYNELFNYNRSIGIVEFKGVIENNRRIHVSQNPKRTDLELRMFNDSLSIIIEFLEIRSHNNWKDFEIDNFRLYQIIQNNKDVKATWVILEKTLIEKGVNIFTNELSNKALTIIEDIYLLNDERTFVTGKLEIITGSNEFSEMLYDSNNNYNKYCINIEAVNNFIMCWKNNNSKKKYSEHFKMINQRLENNMINNIELNFRDLNLSDCYSESESESEMDCDKNSEPMYNFVCNDDGEIEFFNFVGFQQYILMLETKYLTNNKAKMDLSNLYIKLSRGLIDTFKERFEKLKNSNNNSHIIY